jgi:hypothetical protein
MTRYRSGGAVGIALLLAATSSAGPFGLDQRRAPQATPTPLLPSGVQPSDISPGLPGIIEKIRSKEHLTYIEFLVYISALERHPDNVAWIQTQEEATKKARFPAKGWAMIISQIHNEHYEADRNLTLDIVGVDVVDLFLDGTENQGFEEIHTFGMSPKFIIGPKGEKIDIAHAYAGVAALVMRWTSPTPTPASRPS